MKDQKTIKTMLAGLLMIAAVAALAAQITAFAGHQNGRVNGYTTTDLAMFRAKMLPNRFYNEVWFHEMHFDKEGIIVTLSYQLHNLGTSRGYGAIMATVSDAGSGIVGDGFEGDPDKVKIDPQGFGVSIGPNRISLEGNVYRVRFQGQKIRANFTYRIQVPSFQQGDGTLRFTGTEDFVRYNLPIPLATVEGDLFYAGKSLKLTGMGSMNHDWQVLSPLKYMSNWRAFWMYFPSGTVNITECSSADLNGQWLQRLLVATGNRNVFSSHTFVRKDLDFKPVPGGSPNVLCPRRFTLAAVAGPDYLRGEIKVTRIQEKFDVLAAYPYAFRKLAEFLVHETWSYRFWCDYRFELRVNGQTQVLQGAGTGNYVASVKAD